MKNCPTCNKQINTSEDKEAMEESGECLACLIAREEAGNNNL